MTRDARGAATAFASVRDRLVPGAVLALTSHWLGRHGPEMGALRRIVSAIDIEPRVERRTVAGRVVDIRRPGGRCVIMRPLAEQGGGDGPAQDVFFAALDNARYRLDSDDAFTMLDGDIATVSYRFVAPADGGATARAPGRAAAGGPHGAELDPRVARAVAAFALLADGGAADVALAPHEGAWRFVVGGAPVGEAAAAGLPSSSLRAAASGRIGSAIVRRLAAGGLADGPRGTGPYRLTAAGERLGRGIAERNGAG